MYKYHEGPRGTGLILHSNMLSLKLTLPAIARCAPRLVVRLLSIKTELVKHEDIPKRNDTKFITHPAFPHVPWTNEQCDLVKPVHRDPKCTMDKFALGTIQLVRTVFDYATGYKKPHTPEEWDHRFRGTRFHMNESKWLTRIIFLESVAGVPGMAAAFIRHLHSIRVLKRDRAWIETLLDEAYNERMHLLTFIKLGHPSWFTRLFVWIAQGVFCNVFFFTYLLFPRYCHRLVGYLEEEAVSTYSHLIRDLRDGVLPHFDGVTVPEVAQHYWPELTDKSTFEELIQRVRADESKHREVNHTLANLNQAADRNPYAMELKDRSHPQPSMKLDTPHPEGWEKKDLTL